MWQLGALELAEKIRSEQTSSREVLEAHLDLANTIRPVAPSNVLGSPSAVTAAGLSNGLPVGVQIMGDRFTDLRCLTVAAEIESLVGTLTPIDPVTA